MVLWIRQHKLPAWDFPPDPSDLNIGKQYITAWQLNEGIKSLASFTDAFTLLDLREDHQRQLQDIKTEYKIP